MAWSVINGFRRIREPHRLTNVGMLLAMLIVWELEGSPHYASMGENQKIAYENLDPCPHRVRVLSEHLAIYQTLAHRD